MTQRLNGKRVAILATNGFEQSELLEPRRALEAAGARTDIVSPSRAAIRGWRHTDWGSSVDVDVLLEGAEPREYDALVLPGGVLNPDQLRVNEHALAFVRRFVQAGKPIAAICHGPWTLINADAVQGRKLTSWPSLRKDLENAGAEWIDAEVVVDRGLITSRKPEDLPAFHRELVEEIAKGAHRRQSSAAE
jgi:protease I